MNVWKKIVSENGSQKNETVAILVSAKIELKPVTSIRVEGHYKMINGSVQQQDIPFENINKLKLLLLLLLSHFSCVRLCVTPVTAAHQAPLSLGFSRQEHWNGLPFPSPKLKLGAPRYTKHILNYLKGERDSNIKTVGDFNISLSIMHRLLKDKLSKETLSLNFISNQLHMTDIYRKFPPIAAEYTFF